MRSFDRLLSVLVDKRGQNLGERNLHSLLTL